jgi:hypothetical protein
VTTLKCRDEDLGGGKRGVFDIEEDARGGGDIVEYLGLADDNASREVRDMCPRLLSGFV